MLAKDSPLRRLPVNMDPKQAFFIDGLRHAYEIADLALRRLKQELTELSRSGSKGPVDPERYNTAFLDAWAFVDAVDRFRTLWTQLPGLPPDSESGSVPEFSKALSPIRQLRNVADHLATRADYVLSRRGSALGMLQWVTIEQTSPVSGRSCTLRPGFFQGGSLSLLDPGSYMLDTSSPTGLIVLTAGEYSAQLLDYLPQLEARIHHIEAAASTAIAMSSPGTSDALLIGEFVAREQSSGSGAA